MSAVLHQYRLVYTENKQGLAHTMHTERQKVVGFTDDKASEILF